MGALENDQTFYRKVYGFLSHIYVKVILPSRQNEAMLGHATRTISVLYYATSYVLAKVSPLKIAFGQIQKLMGGETGITMSRVKKFEKLNGGGRLLGT